MKEDKAFANIEIRGIDKVIKKRCLVDTGASISIISKELADNIGRFIPFMETYEVKTANKGGVLRIIGVCLVKLVFEGIEVPGDVVIEVAENLREEIDIVIGRPEIDKWDIIFTPEGPRPSKVPIKFEII